MWRLAGFVGTTWTKPLHSIMELPEFAAVVKTTKVALCCLRSARPAWTLKLSFSSFVDEIGKWFRSKLVHRRCSDFIVIHLALVLVTWWQSNCSLWFNWLMDFQFGCVERCFSIDNVVGHGSVGVRGGRGQSYYRRRGLTRMRNIKALEMEIEMTWSLLHESCANETI